MSKGKQSKAKIPASVDPPWMASPSPSALPGDPTNPMQAGYEIRIKDHLETYWYDWFEDWAITNLESGEVLLRCASVDQSALHGALNKIRDLNLTLLSVTRFSKE